MIYYEGKVRKTLRANEIEGRYSQYKKVKLETLGTTFLDAGYSTVRLNSSYLETADREFDERGVDLFTILILMLMLLTALFMSIQFNFFNFSLVLEPSNSRPVSYRTILIFVSLLFIVVFSVVMLSFFKDAFNHTHYPIRFNRKTRMVHLFLRKGLRKHEVVSVPWDEIIFCSDKFMYMLGANQWGISGHILSKDKAQVEQTFQLGYSSFLKPTVDSYWEFIRRYMEEGPEAVKDAIPFYIPVEKCKETFKDGIVHMLAQTHSRGSLSFGGICMILTGIPSCVGRFVAMKTSKIPVWPQEIEEQCQIESSDPINLSAENNPTWTWSNGWVPYHKGISE
ncbi:DUF6708 domain-containing protein [Limnobaculum parvum]|uniref:DUF6708 domain-containing protein n=1 Tax=Limnobaculum parvum TaxID=2172103 RepID=A0A2Y9TUD0_9GAMM|nr:DUF6708 domain-containing protein [Limnobaculum parvum]AWH87246.1 hypothetical protein HYN51_00935 [Limnobaculum parvum]